MNLTLRVLGKRQDGFHEIESLLAFADVGDLVEIAPGEQTSLTVIGPMAREVQGAENLIETAWQAFSEKSGLKPSANITLHKHLPVAAGLGGGSADAAAVLRLVIRTFPQDLDEAQFGALAAGLGSDVPACVMSEAAIMTGRGENVAPLRGFPELPAVLVNPRLRVSTADVYRKLNANTELNPSANFDAVEFQSIEDVISFMAEHPNDLEPAAIELQPQIKDVLEQLNRQPGCLVARMSGSGATCFGLFALRDEAMSAADALLTAYPDWWVKDTVLS